MSLLPDVERELNRVAGKPARPSPRRRLAEALAPAVVAAVAAAVIVVLFVTPGGRGGLVRHPDHPAPPARQDVGAKALPAPRPQPGAWVRGGATCPLAPRERDLPSHVGCVSVVRTDVTGNGRRDLVLLYSTLAARPTGARYRPELDTLEVVPRGGAKSKVVVGRGRPAVIAFAANVDRRTGAELFVRLGGRGEYGVYTWRGGRLVAAGPTLSAGGTATSGSDFSCRTSGRAVIVQRRFRPLSATTRRVTTTTFRWHGGRLIAARPVVITGGRHTPIPTGVDGSSCGAITLPIVRRAPVRP